MSFAKLKKQRENRQAISFASLSSSTVPVSDSSAADGHDIDNPIFDIPNGLYAQLPSYLEIRISERGRGIFVKNNQPTGLKAGAISTKTSLSQRTPLICAVLITVSIR
jgi:hypothetical protein